MQISINNLSKSSIKVNTLLTSMLKTIRLSKIPTFKKLEANDNQVADSDNKRPVEFNNPSLNFEYIEKPSFLDSNG